MHEKLLQVLSQGIMLNARDRKYFEFSFFKPRFKNKIIGTDIHKARLYCLLFMNEAGSLLLNTINNMCDKIEIDEGDLLKSTQLIEGDVLQLAQIVELNIEKLHGLNPYFLMIIMRLLYLNKYIEVAFRLRCIMVKCYLELDHKKIDDIALLDVLKSTAEYSSDLSFEVPDRLRNKFPAVLDNLNLYFNNRKRLVDSTCLLCRDDSFRDYLLDKTIAIVGPISLGQQNGHEIDGFDIVIRFNFVGLEGYDASEYGTKTNVSYYINRTIYSKINEISSMAKELDYLIHQRVSPREFSEFENSNIPLREMLFSWRTSTNPYLLGQPNAVQKVLFDILRFSTGKIKVFNSNLFVSKSLNSAYRQSNITSHEFIWHDVFSQFVFTKRLFETGVIEADKILSDVLSMSLHEYAQEMNEVYGNKLCIE